MYATPTLATRFAGNTFVIRSEAPLGEDQMRQAAPSIFAEGKHATADFSNVACSHLDA